MRNEVSVLSAIAHPFIATLCAPLLLLFHATHPIPSGPDWHLPRLGPFRPPSLTPHAATSRCSYHFFMDERNVYLLQEFVPGGQLYRLIGTARRSWGRGGGVRGGRVRGGAVGCSGDAVSWGAMGCHGVS